MKKLISYVLIVSLISSMGLTCSGATFSEICSNALTQVQVLERKEKTQTNNNFDSPSMRSELDLAQSHTLSDKLSEDVTFEEVLCTIAGGLLCCFCLVGIIVIAVCVSNSTSTNAEIEMFALTPQDSEDDSVTENLSSDSIMEISSTNTPDVAEMINPGKCTINLHSESGIDNVKLCKFYDQNREEIKLEINRDKIGGFVTSVTVNEHDIDSESQYILYIQRDRWDPNVKWFKGREMQSGSLNFEV